MDSHSVMFKKRITGGGKHERILCMFEYSDVGAFTLPEIKWTILDSVDEFDTRDNHILISYLYTEIECSVNEHVPDGPNTEIMIRTFDGETYDKIARVIIFIGNMITVLPTYGTEYYGIYDEDKNIYKIKIIAEDGQVRYIVRIEYSNLYRNFKCIISEE